MCIEHQRRHDWGLRMPGSKVGRAEGCASSVLPLRRRAAGAGCAATQCRLTPAQQRQQCSSSAAASQPKRSVSNTPAALTAGQPA